MPLAPDEYRKLVASSIGLGGVQWVGPADRWPPGAAG